MGRSSVPSELRCMKHPKHRQSPGVCSVCLRERLSRLYTNNSSNATASSSTSSSLSSSPYSSVPSSCSSSCASPAHRSRAAAALLATFSMPLSSVNAKRSSSSDRHSVNGGLVMMMRRSRSMVGHEGSRNVNDNGDFRSRREGKKRGFWSKLLFGFGGKRRNDSQVLLMNTNSMREKRAKMVC